MNVMLQSGTHVVVRGFRVGRGGVGRGRVGRGGVGRVFSGQSHGEEGGSDDELSIKIESVSDVRIGVRLGYSLSCWRVGSCVVFGRRTDESVPFAGELI